MSPNSLDAELLKLQSLQRLVSAYEKAANDGSMDAFKRAIQCSRTSGIPVVYVLGSLPQFNDGLARSYLGHFLLLGAGILEEPDFGVLEASLMGKIKGSALADDIDWLLKLGQVHLDWVKDSVLELRG